MVKHWITFNKKEKTSCYSIDPRSALGFIEYIYATLGTYSAAVRARSFICGIKRVTGRPFDEGQRLLLDKYVSGVFNINPPKIQKAASTWDVNVLLDYFVKLGPNTKIKWINILAGKLILQLMITQGCRSGEIFQLQLSTMKLVPGGVKFHLQQPTKTFNCKTGSATKKLQVMTIREFSANILLCPVATLLSYIERTKCRRGKIDKLFMLMTTQEPRPATQTTMVRWAKEVMQEAGLGQFRIHSTRSASSTSALLMGMSLDDIVSKVGWLRATTFIKHYLKPLDPGARTGNSVSTSTVHKRKIASTTSITKKKPAHTPLLSDPHNFLDIFSKRTPKTTVTDLPMQKAQLFYENQRSSLLPPSVPSATVSTPSETVFSGTEKVHEVVHDHGIHDDDSQVDYVTISMPGSPSAESVYQVPPEIPATFPSAEATPLPELSVDDIVTFELDPDPLDLGDSELTDERIVDSAVNKYHAQLKPDLGPASDIDAIIKQVSERNHGHVDGDYTPDYATVPLFDPNVEDDPVEVVLPEGRRRHKPTLKGQMAETIKLLTRKNMKDGFPGMNDNLQSVMHSGQNTRRKPCLDRGIAYLKFQNEKTAFGNMIREITKPKHNLGDDSRLTGNNPRLHSSTAPITIIDLTKSFPEIENTNDSIPGSIKKFQFVNYSASDIQADKYPLPPKKPDSEYHLPPKKPESAKLQPCNTNTKNQLRKMLGLNTDK